MEPGRFAASTSIREEKQATYGNASAGSIRSRSVSRLTQTAAPNAVVSAETPSTLIDVGPAYRVDISAEGKALATSDGQDQNEKTEKEPAAQTATAKQNQQEWRIHQEVAKLQRTDLDIRTHEQAHMSAGGAFAGVASYIYIKGPDGKDYISGGEVPIQAPEGKTPEETVKNMEIVKRAALAPADPSGQDLAVAAAAMQIESRARAAIRQGRFITQAEMDGKESDTGTLDRPEVLPTSMAGLIATLMPEQGMMGTGVPPD